MKTFRRYLGAFETAQALTDNYYAFNVTAILRLENGPAPEKIHRALNILQQQNPALNVKLGRDKKGFAFYSGEIPSIPFKSLPRTGGEHWRQVTEEELITKIDSANGPLARCTVLYTNGPDGEISTEVIVTFLHVIADAVSGYYFLHRLLTLSTAPDIEDIQGGAPPGEIKLSEPAESFFPARYRGLRKHLAVISFFLRQMSVEISYRWKRRRLPSDKKRINPEARCRILDIHLPEALSRELIRRARRERVTTYNTLSIAMLSAVIKHRYAGIDVPHYLFSFADFRPFIEPAMDEKYLGCYSTLLRHTFTPGPSGYFWNRARRLNSFTLESYKRGDKYLFSLVSPFIIKTVTGMRSQRMCTTALSYTGPATVNTVYGETRVNGLHSFVTTFDIGPEFAAQSRWFNQKLHLDIIYLDTDMGAEEAKKIVDEIIQILENAVQIQPEVD